MRSIHTNLAPQAIGTYSQAIQCSNTVYISGQLPLNPATLLLCSDEFILQIEQVFSNISAICQAAGGSLEHVVKLTIYLTDLVHVSQINTVMLRYFSQPYPARAVIGVNFLPKDAQIEIDAIMILPN
ncbi:MAG: Rid family detoxifying hydrolase [Legionella sp.]